MNSIVSIYRRFPTKEDCLTHLEAVRWGDSPHCPYCKSERVSKHTEQDRRSRWQCSLCRKSFSVTVGTIFHNSHVDLQRWFLLISLMFSAKKGLSALQAARDLEMRSATVWSMMHRIRKAKINDFDAKERKLGNGVVLIHVNGYRFRSKNEIAPKVKATMLDKGDLDKYPAVWISHVDTKQREKVGLHALALDTPENVATLHEAERIEKEAALMLKKAEKMRADIKRVTVEEIKAMALDVKPE